MDKVDQRGFNNQPSDWVDARQALDMGIRYEREMLRFWEELAGRPAARG